MVASLNYFVNALHVGGLFSRLQAMEARNPPDRLIAAADRIMASESPAERAAALEELEGNVMVRRRSPESLGAVGYLFLKNLDPGMGTGRRSFAARDGLSLIAVFLDDRGLASLDFLVRHRIAGFDARLHPEPPARRMVLLEALQIISKNRRPDRRWEAALALVDLWRREECVEIRQRAFEILEELALGLSPRQLKSLARRFLRELRYHDPLTRPYRDDRDIAQALGIIARKPLFRDHAWVMNKILARTRHPDPREREVALWTARALGPVLRTT